MLQFMGSQRAGHNGATGQQKQQQTLGKAIIWWRRRPQWIFLEGITEKCSHCQSISLRKEERGYLAFFLPSHFTVVETRLKATDMTVWATEPAGGQCESKHAPSHSRGMHSTLSGNYPAGGQKVSPPRDKQETCQCGDREYVDQNPTMRFNFGLFML